MPSVVDVLEAATRLKSGGRVLRSPLRRSEWLSSRARADVYLKLESLQPTGSFKIRGAFNAALRHVERTRTMEPWNATAAARFQGSMVPLVTASAGNHGLALAHAAEALGLPLTVFVPAGAPRAKQDAIRRHRVELETVADYDEAERAAKAHAAGGRAIYVSPYAHPDVIAGAGTVALEMLEDRPDAAAIVVPLGGGGLASGIALVARASGASARVIGVEAEASTAFTASLAAGRITQIDPKPTLADGLAGNLDPDSPTFEIVRDMVDRVVTVSEAELAAAMRGLAEHEHLIAEGAGAAAVAAIQAGPSTLLRAGPSTSLRAGRAGASGPIVAIVSGANVDLDRLSSVFRSG